MTHQVYYSNNSTYTSFLENQDPSSFEKYVDHIFRFTSVNSRILDVGCGSGLVMSLVRQKRKEIFGIEVSNTSVHSCKKKGLNASFYDGNKIPFEDGYFDMVGSINVLEHTDNPIGFLDENLRVLKRSGYLIVVCPNFLSITNNYHKNTRGVIRKCINILSLTKLFLTGDARFNNMETTSRQSFQPDDDAVNETNHLSIRNWASSRRLSTIYCSAFQDERKGLLSFIDRTSLKILFGACFFVFQKN